jgi:hypothetical protein
MKSYSNISFEQALSESNDFLDALSLDSLPETEVYETVRLLTSTENGARGFFVNYLTTEYEIAKHSSIQILNALRVSSEIVAELLVKNLAMSTATAITHQENGDLELDEGSKIVQKRTLELISKLDLPLVREKLLILYENLQTMQGQYQGFLERWGYDQEQRDAIASILPL